MGKADELVERLRDEVLAERSSDYSSFVERVEPSVRAIEVSGTAETAEMVLAFPESPTATALVRRLDETDREARRVVAGFERGVRPEQLRGRGVRLVPPQFGLRVERAEPGSLDVLLAFGGLYQVVTSQPLSFALNLGALLGYGRAALRARKPDEPTSPQVLTIPLPTVPNLAQGDRLSESGGHVELLPGHPAVLVPSDYASVRIQYVYPDGTRLEIDCSE